MSCLKHSSFISQKIDDEVGDTADDKESAVLQSEAK